MQRALGFAIALLAAGCAEDELERAPTHIANAVQLADRDPGAACRPLAPVEVRSGRTEMPTSDQLRAVAAERGANYVVIDTFRVYDESEDQEVITRAHLFSCPSLALGY